MQDAEKWFFERKGDLVKRTAVLVMMFVVASIPSWVGAGDEEVFSQPETMLREIYSAVSNDLGKEPDWDRVRSFFHPEAVIALRATPEATQVFNVESFIQDFKDFYGRIDPEKNVFRERVVALKVTPFGNMAYGHVVYEAAVTTSDRPPQRGLDAWHLVKQDGRWWFVSVVNDNESVAGPIPDGALAN
jgi:hypothetical protein